MISLEERDRIMDNIELSDLVSAPVTLEVEVRMPTQYGEFTMTAYRNERDLNNPHIVYTSGEVKDGIIVSVHYECLEGDLFTSKICECRDKLDESLSAVAQGRVLIYLRKNKAFEGNRDGHQEDFSEYSIAAGILKDLGLTEFRMMSYFKAKELEKYGFIVSMLEKKENKEKENRYLVQQA